MQVKPNTKEQLVDFMLKHISLGTYDKKFLNNLVQMNFAVKNPVTTNQADLLNKITSRYHRQFLKKELNSEELIQLPWTLPLIQSSTQFTQAYISIVEDKDIIIHSPFKKEFVKNLKALDYMKWDRDEKFWSTPYAEFRLKELIRITKENYSTVNFCPIIKKILVEIKPYEDAKYWTPTLIERKGNYYVVACNTILNEMLMDVELNAEPANIAKLVRLGINIDIDVDSFAKEINPHLEVHDMSSLIESLRSIGTDFVILNERSGVNKEYMYNVANHLKANKIKHSLIKNDRVRDFTITDLRKYEMPVKINLGMSNTEDGTKYLGKIISLVNSRPIEIK